MSIESMYETSLQQTFLLKLRDVVSSFCQQCRHVTFHKNRWKTYVFTRPKSSESFLRIVNVPGAIFQRTKHCFILSTWIIDDVNSSESVFILEFSVISYHANTIHSSLHFNVVGYIIWNNVVKKSFNIDKRSSTENCILDVMKNHSSDGKIMYGVCIILYIYTNNLTSSMYDIKFM